MNIVCIIKWKNKSEWILKIETLAHRSHKKRTPTHYSIGSTPYSGERNVKVAFFLNIHQMLILMSFLNAGHLLAYFIVDIMFFVSYIGVMGNPTNLFNNGDY